MARDFASYSASQNHFGELGPVCDGAINETGGSTSPGAASKAQWSCLGSWRGKVKFGAPHVVDHGEELAHSEGKRAYMVGHGADKEHQPQSWMQGSQVYLSRTKGEVTPEVMANCNLNAIFLVCHFLVFPPCFGVAHNTIYMYLYA